MERKATRGYGAKTIEVGPRVHEGGALPAKQMIRVEILVFLCNSGFSVLPQVKNQHLTVLDKPPRVVHVDAAAAWRDKETVERISQDTQDTQTQWSVFSWFHSAPQTVFSTRCLVVSRSESRGVFLVVLVFPQFHVTCFMFLLCRMFTTPHPLRRRVGKQTPAAPELQLFEDLLGSVKSRNCLGTCVSRNLWRVHSITTNQIQACS